MTHPLNQRRAASALAACKAAEVEFVEGKLEPCGITDLLSNMMHLCEQEGIDFDAQLESARGHYEAEQGDGDDIEQDCRRLEGYD